MAKGAVWRGGGERRARRLRRDSHWPPAGEELAGFYNGELLSATPPRAECRYDACRYSVWLKPAGLFTQGSRFGDHCALLRQTEPHFRPAPPVCLVHRLDREVRGADPSGP